MTTSCAAAPLTQAQAIARIQRCSSSVDASWLRYCAGAIERHDYDAIVDQAMAEVQGILAAVMAAGETPPRRTITIARTQAGWTAHGDDGRPVLLWDVACTTAREIGAFARHMQAKGYRVERRDERGGPQG